MKLGDMSMKRVFLCVESLLLLLAGGCSWVMNAHGMAARHFDDLQRGMSGEQIRDLLGEPSTVYSNADSGVSWTYSRWTWCIIHLELSADDALVSWEHDH